MDHDDAYANAPYIPGAADYPPRWAAEAAAFRAALGARARTGLAYGAGARQTYDLFAPEGAARGLAVFIHGGFWRAFGRCDWSHLAAGGVAAGWAVAVAQYTLCPHARLRDITVEMRAAVSAAAEQVAGPVVVTGHSAGGHLAARMACPDVALPVADRLARVVPISPLADLRPLMHTAMNADFGLDAAEAWAESPIAHVPRAAAHVWVGGAERPAFLDQARWLSEAWGAPLTIDHGRHHFDVIDGLTDPRSPLMHALIGGIDA